MAYTANKTQSGTYEIMQDGQRVATGSEAILGNYGLTPASVGSGVTYTPENLTAPATQMNVPPYIPPTAPNTTDYDKFISQLQAPSAEQTAAQDTQNTLVKSITDIFAKQAGQGARKAELETAAGIPDVQKQLNETLGQIRQNNAGAFAATQQQEDRLAPTFAIQGTQAQIERQRAVKNYGLAAVAEALQGNIALAQDNVQRALDAEFKPLETQLEYYKFLYTANKDELERADKKQADRLSLILTERERLLNQEKEDKTNKYNLITSAAGAGIPNATLALAQNAKTYDEAYALLLPEISKAAIKSKKAADYLATLQAEKVRLENEKINQDLYGTPGGAGGLATTGTLGSAAQLLASKFGSKFQQEAFLKNAQSLAAGENKGQFADYIFSTAIDTISDTDARKKALSQYKIVNKLTYLEGLMGQYQAAGGNTNIFSGSIENIRSKLGTVGDPQLRSLATAMLDTLDGLARDRTGAVITPSEERLYDRMLPSPYKTAELNTAIIDGLRGSMLTDLNSVLRYQLTGTGFEGLEPYLGVQNNVTQSVLPKEDVYSTIVSQPSTGTYTGDFFSGLGNVINQLFYRGY